MSSQAIICTKVVVLTWTPVSKRRRGAKAPWLMPPFCLITPVATTCTQWDGCTSYAMPTVQVVTMAVHPAYCYVYQRQAG